MGLCRLLYWCYAEEKNDKGQAVMKRVHGKELQPRWNGEGLPPVHNKPPHTGAPKLERTHSQHFKMTPGIMLGPRCNHDVGIVVKLPVLQHSDLGGSCSFTSERAAALLPSPMLARGCETHSGQTSLGDHSCSAVEALSHEDLDMCGFTSERAAALLPTPMLARGCETHAGKTSLEDSSNVETISDKLFIPCLLGNQFSNLLMVVRV